MITLIRSPKFNREFKKFVKKRQDKAESIVLALDKFVKNPIQPSLNLEKLAGSEIWTIRIDHKNRIFFIWSTSNIVILIDVGPHDKYRMY